MVEVDSLLIGFLALSEPARGTKITMTSKTIVLWGQEDLLSSTVELFLTAQKGWNVVNIPFEQNADALMQAVNTVHPDVVIIQKGDYAINFNFPASLFKDHPRLKVITLNPNNNLMEVYSKQNILIHSLSDLVSVVEAKPVF